MISVALVGDTALIERLQALSPALRAKLKQSVWALALMLEGYVKTSKLSGQVLAHRTGQLKSSIQSEVLDQGLAVYGIVYSAGNVKYARIHEFGYEGPEQVREHTRTMLFGKTVAPFTVPAFTRQMKMPERSFLRSALRDKAAQISQQMKAAVLEGVQAQVRG